MLFRTKVTQNLQLIDPSFSIQIERWSRDGYRHHGELRPPVTTSTYSPLLFHQDAGRCARSLPPSHLPAVLHAHFLKSTTKTMMTTTQSRWRFLYLEK